MKLYVLFLSSLLLACAGGYGESVWSVRGGPVYRPEMKMSVRGDTHASSVYETSMRRQGPDTAVVKQNDRDWRDEDIVGETETIIWMPEYRYSTYIRVSADGTTWTETFIETRLEDETFSLETSTSIVSLPGTEQRRTLTTDTSQQVDSARLDSSAEFDGVGGMLEGVRKGGSLGQVRHNLLVGCQGVFGSSTEMRQSTIRGTMNYRSHSVFSDVPYRYDATSRVERLTTRIGSITNVREGASFHESRTYQDPVVTGESIRSQSVPFSGHVQVRSSADIYTTWLGFSAEADVTSRFRIEGIARLNLHLVDLSIVRDEFVVDDSNGAMLHSWHDHADTQKLTWGMSLAAGATYDLNARWYGSMQVVYDRVFDDVTHRVGPAELTYDLSAFQGSLLLGRRF